MPLRIKSLAVSTGYLEPSPVTFAEGLTCIIGARGTCKSTIIETIRFAFHCDPVRIRLLTEPATESDGESGGTSCRGLIRATLAGGTVKCVLTRDTDGEQSEWTIERDIDGPSRVFHEDVQEIADHSLLNEIEIYSQGDLQAIAQQGNRRLELIDRPHQAKIASLLARRTSAAKRLTALGPELRFAKMAMDARRNDLKNLDAYRGTLSDLQRQRPALSTELDNEREAYLKRKELIDQSRLVISNWKEAVHSLVPLVEQEQSHRAAITRLGETSYDDARELRELFAERADFLQSLRKRLEDSEISPEDKWLEQLHAMFEKDNERYYALRKEQQDVNDTLKKEDALKQQIRHLEGLERELLSLSEKHQRLAQERLQLRNNIDQINDQLYQLRLQQVEEINSAFSDVVLLTLHQGTQADRYRGRVARLLQGSRIRSQDEVARDLADKVRPSDLVDIVEQGDARRLSELLDRDMGQMARLVGYLVDNPSLYEVEEDSFEDWLEITMFVDGVAKPINQLSRGQMATALLPLILRPANYPLLFDQPEDDLDNRFIYETLVRRIRELKQQRQLILVTHNANIPVLGEADRVVVMSMQNPTRAAAPIEGTVDTAKTAILAILEGGPEAFKRRQQKYGSLVE